MAGKGRSPCCDRTKVKRGPWSPAEDLRLITFIQKHGHANWRAVPQQAGLSRCGKSCRLRWINYLRPDVRRGNFSPEEEETILRLHKSMGNKWSKIASHLPGRTDNEIKNVWNTHLKKRVGRNGDTCDQNQAKDSPTSYSSSGSCISYGDMNLDKGPGFYEAQESVGGQFSAGITEAQCQQIDGPKEESFSPGGSNISSNVQSVSSVEDVSMPMQEPTTLIHSNVTSDQVQNLMMTTDQAHQGMVSDEKLEIPFDSDVDFWSLLDSLLSPTQPWEVQAPEPEVSKQESTNPGPGEVAEIDSWLKYFEDELGLEEGTDNDYPEKDAGEELVMKASENEVMFKPEVFPATPHFSMWPPPSPPPHQDFGI